MTRFFGIIDHNPTTLINLGGGCKKSDDHSKKIIALTAETPPNAKIKKVVKIWT